MVRTREMGQRRTTPYDVRPFADYLYNIYMKIKIWFDIVWTRDMDRRRLTSAHVSKPYDVRPFI